MKGNHLSYETLINVLNTGITGNQSFDDMFMKYYDACVEILITDEESHYMTHARIEVMVERMEMLDNL